MMYKAKPPAVLYLLVIFLCLITACSSSAPPITPEIPDNEPGENLPATGAATSAPGHHLLGAFSISFDPAMETIECVPNRAAMAHYNVTPYLFPPYCDNCFEMKLLEFWPEQRRFKIGVTVRNPFDVIGYDVRGILMHNQPGWDVEYNDGYTSLFDDGGEITINPYLLLDDQNHSIHPGHKVIRHFTITFPDDPDFSSLNFIVDASFPGHCEDVIELRLRNPKTESIDYGGTWAIVTVEAVDWQEDILSITLDASSIGAGVVGLEHKQYTDYWRADYFVQGASGGVPPGEYRLLITAISNTPIATYTYVNVFLNPLPSPIDVSPGNYHFGNRRIAVTDNHRLVTRRRYGGIDVFDVSKSEKPQWAGRVIYPAPHTYFEAYDMAVVGDRVFLADRKNGMVIIDINFIYQPEILGVLDLCAPLCVAFGGGLLYAGGMDHNNPEYGGMGAITIIDPGTEPLPEILGTLEVEHWVQSIVVHNGYLYFTTLNLDTTGHIDTRLYVADLADPEDPVIVGEMPLPFDFPNYRLTARGDILFGFCGFVWEEKLLFACDITEPAQPETVGFLQFPPFQSHWLGLNEDYVYVSGEKDGIDVVDINPPEEMHLVGHLETEGEVHDISIGIECMYVTEVDPGSLSVYDVEPPDEPALLRRLDRIDRPDELVLDGNYAYLIDRNYTFKVLDISIPERAYILSSVMIPGENPYLWDLAVDGDAACVLRGGHYSAKRLHIVSIADPENPQFVANISGFGLSLSRKLLAGGGYAYVACDEGVGVIDIDPPESSHISALFETPEPVQLLDLYDGKLYLYTKINGLEVYDVTIPENPQLLGGIPYLGIIRSLAARKNYAYVGGIDSIMVLDVSDPQEMEVVAQTPVLFKPDELFLMGGFLFSPARHDGVWIANIFPPGTIEPVFVLVQPPPHDYVSDVTCQNGYMFVTARAVYESNLRIYKWW